MAITNNNTATAIGDVIEFSGSLPMMGVTALTGLVEGYTGETASRYWQKEYKMTTDGLNYPPTWTALTSSNLAAESVSTSNLVNFKFRLTRVGSDATGNLEYNSIQVQGAQSLDSSTSAFEDTVFDYFFDSPHEAEILQWCISVLEKCYIPGIVPIYHVRGKNKNANGEDDDYISFWRTVCCFFALTVAYARRFENFYLDPSLLRNYLQERGAYICSHMSLQDMQYVMGNLYDEMRKRGTGLVGMRKGDIINTSGDLLPVDGELLRLLCISDTQELVFDHAEPQNVAWFIGDSSPLYQSLENHYPANKMHSNSDIGYDATEVAKFPTHGTVSTAVDGSENVIEIAAPPSGERYGIGYDTANALVDELTADNLIQVDSNQGYLFEFEYKGSDDTRLTCGIECVNSQLIGNKTRNLSVPSVYLEDFAVSKLEPSTSGASIWSKVSILLYPKGTSYSDAIKEAHPQLSGVNNLQIWGTDSAYCMPQIYNDNSDGVVTDPLKVRNITFTPMSTTNTPSGHIGVQNWYNIFYTKNASEYTDVQLKDIMERDLLPLGSIVNLQPIEES